MTVLGIHHLGLSVADVDEALALLRRHGFEGGAPFPLAGADAARGNGLDSVSMRVTFVADGASTLELIEHVDGAVLDAVPEPGDRGHQAWRIPRPTGTVPRLPGVVVHAAHRGVVPQVELTTADAAASSSLLGALGLRPRPDRAFEAPGLTVLLHEAQTTRAAPSVRAHGRSHLALRVADAEGVHRRLGEQGFDCVSAPIAHGDAVRWFFVRDPGGSGEIEVVQDGS